MITGLPALRIEVVRWLQRDRDGGLWIGLQNGLQRLEISPPAPELRDFLTEDPRGSHLGELLTAIEEEKPDLLVLSTKGRSNLADVMIGSTARKMYHRSPIPLISVPAAYSDFP